MPCRGACSPSPATPLSQKPRPRLEGPPQHLQLAGQGQLRDDSCPHSPCPAISTSSVSRPPCWWSPPVPLPPLGTWGPPEEAPIKHPAIQKTDFGRNEKRGGGGGGRCDRERMLVPPTNSGRGSMTLDRAALCHTRGTRTRLFRWVWGQPRQINGGDYYKLGFIIYINIHQLEADLINFLNY